MDIRVLGERQKKFECCKEVGHLCQTDRFLGAPNFSTTHSTKETFLYSMFKPIQSS